MVSNGRIKNITNDSNEKLDFDAKIIDNYPPHYNYGGFITTGKEYRAEFGYRYNFASSGARISSKDYSGEYLFNSLITRQSHGLFVVLTLNDTSKSRLRILFEGGYMKALLKLTEDFQVYDDTFDSRNLYFTPSVSFSYSYKRITAALRTGYEMDIYHRINDEVISKLITNDKLKENMKFSGYFISLSLAINLN